MGQTVETSNCKILPLYNDMKHTCIHRHHLLVNDLKNLRTPFHVLQSFRHRFVFRRECKKRQNDVSYLS